MEKKMQLAAPTALTAKEQEQIRALALNMGIAHSLICRDYLTKLHSAGIIPLDDATQHIEPKSTLRLFRITAVSYDKLESITEKLNSLFCALSRIQDCNLVMIINNRIEHGTETLELYLGLSGNYVERTTEAGSILKRSIEGNFPGCELQACLDEDIEELMPTITYKNAATPCAISSVSVDAVKRSPDESYIQGMEKFTDGMRGNPYTLMLIASPVADKYLNETLSAYRELYTQISPYRVTTTTLNETHGDGTAVTIGTQISRTLSRTKNWNNTFGITNSVNVGKNISETKKDMTGSLIEIGASLLGVAGGTALGIPAVGLIGAGYLGKLVGTEVRSLTGKTPQTETLVNQRGQTQSMQKSEGGAEQQSVQQGENLSQTLNQNHNTGISVQRSVENKHVVDVLKSLDRQILKMSSSFGQGAYNVAAYVVASDKIVSETGASLYCSLLSGNQPDSVAAINTWDGADDVERLQEYLVRALHPRMRLLSSGAFNDLNLTTFVPCSEMPLHFFMPRKSLAGLPVSRRAEFARSIPCLFDRNAPHIHLGEVLHFGRVEDYSIALTPEALCSHTCIVGSPGSGKSNMSYQLLLQLMQQGIHFMVVEPAKGEYAQVLGGYPSVRCLSTRLNDSNVLSLNPFAFPKGANAIKHAESLLSILTTCWTMYAAMNEILKDAIVQVYENAGWNMSDNGLPWDDEYYFPTFQDLMRILPDLIEQSDYSNEVKGNYKGSLLTRVKSMTNGANKKIFGRDRLTDEELFNSNLIVDISSIGSSENRALLMGLLIIRLNEFRRSENKGMNRALHHVTLLEEAHNILSVSQAGTVSSKAVELINRAIAEMRSAGEGFIIVDQTPSRLDSSVISNTANKIVFNLQNAEDSLPMGKAMSLTPEQTEEIAVLPRGACIVRSREWSAPVRIKVPLFDTTRYKPYEPPPRLVDMTDIRIVRGQMLTALIQNDLELAEALSKDLFRDEDKDRLLLDAFDVLRADKKIPVPYRVELYKNFFDTANWFRAPTRETMQHWDRDARKQLSRRARINPAEQNRIIQALLLSLNKPEAKRLLEEWSALNQSR